MRAHISSLGFQDIISLTYPMNYDRQTILTTVTGRSHMMKMTGKVSVEIQDGWCKDAERIKNVEKQL